MKKGTGKVLDLSKKLKERKRVEHEKKAREIVKRANKRLNMFKKPEEKKQDDDLPDPAA